MAISGLATGPFTPRSLPGLGYWWVFSDMPTNINVTNWVDRIQSSVWTNKNTDASRPTNSSLGVHFKRSSQQWLTNELKAVFDTNSSHFLILERTTAGGFQDILDCKNTGDSELMMFNDNKLTWWGGAQQADGVPPLSAFFDFCFMPSLAENKIRWYTNGLASNTNNSTAIPANFCSWGWLGGIAFSGYFDGYIKEILIWTNRVLSSSEIAQLHTYYTNLYGYTP